MKFIFLWAKEKHHLWGVISLIGLLSIGFLLDLVVKTYDCYVFMSIDKIGMLFKEIK